MEREDYREVLRPGRSCRVEGGDDDQPTYSRARSSDQGQQRLHDQQVDVFVQQLLEIRSRLDFEVGTRGWCYLLENEGVIGKDEFDRMETLIGDWRKSGQLPLDFCANDEKRAPVNLEDLDIQSPEVYARDRAVGWRCAGDGMSQSAFGNSKIITLKWRSRRTTCAHY